MNADKSKETMLKNILRCLTDGRAKDLSDAEIDRCMDGRAAVGALTMYAKQFRDQGLLKGQP